MATTHQRFHRLYLRTERERRVELDDLVTMTRTRTDEGAEIREENDNY